MAIAAWQANVRNKSTNVYQVHELYYTNHANWCTISEMPLHEEICRFDYHSPFLHRTPICVIRVIRAINSLMPCFLT